ncbi:HlyD family type I secretion periplasmic adaptor subunit [Aureimonas sp. AU40]|uniref:HlyD family type I secretion periplasmic adaptor subunit n=1 Tax=Aureimonas sp. AU40 TaxID=1637747 RepID=UPI0007804280|nr:HlyD family type I secretion periplasmic adaptor subunit [Aureimonas sp. AU40]
MSQDALIPRPAGPSEALAIRPSWTDGVPTNSRTMTLVGLLTSGAFLLGFGIWATTAPLSGAAIAHGYVAAAGRNLQIQHLEGGIISDILVREGDRIDSNQALYRMDSTGAAAQRNRLRNQLFALEARAARLAAERDGERALVFPDVLQVRPEDPALAKVLDEQVKEFTTKLEGHRREMAIIQQQIAALEEQIRGLGDQKVAAQEQLAVVKDELKRRKSLLDRGLANRREYTDFLLSQAQLTGQIGEFGASVLAARTQMEERREQIARLQSKRVETAASDLNEARARIADIDEQLQAAETVLERVTVRSPSAGIVVKLNYNARGAVVSPGQPMAEILPTGESMIVEARLTPQDIDQVHTNQPAELRFPALNRLTPSVDATVTFVSPDRIVDPRTDQPYYIARLRLAERLPPGVDLAQIYPGMPVETYIKTGERTFLEYLLKPLEDSFSRAFRET